MSWKKHFGARTSAGRPGSPGRASAGLARRAFLKAAGAGALAVSSGPWVISARDQQSELLEVQIISNYALGIWFYEPVGLYVKPGQTVRWSSSRFGATATAYHPSNDHHELRIPEKAKPFASGELDGERTPPETRTFQWTFDVEGTYDFYSRNHEVLGLVGRIVVGKPGGPGEKPPGYGAREGRAPMFPDAIRVLDFVKSEDIVQKKTIAFPRQMFQRRFPS